MLQVCENLLNDLPLIENIEEKIADIQLKNIVSLTALE